MKKLPKVTLRWLYSVFGVIVLILIGFVITMSAVVFSYYESSVENLLTTRGENLASYYTKYISPEYPTLEGSIITLTNDFADKDKMELQIINSRGECIYTSLGYAVGSIVGEDALIAYENGINAPYKGVNPSTEERVMALSVPLKSHNGSIVGVLRVVTSLEEVWSHAWVIVFALLAICLGIILFVFVTNYFFIGTIITPLKTISETADRIAHGDMGARIENRYNDEVGQLVDSINNMASEIAENEKLQNEFISSVSHELRTPMTAIKGWSETVLLCDPQKDGKTINRGLRVINAEVERLSRMVEELLDFSRIQGGHVKLKLKVMDLGEKVQSVVNIMKERALGENKTIVYDLPVDLIPVNGDTDRLNQAFINIIDNGIKHSYENSKIDITVFTNKDKAIVEIKDFGEGIKKEDLPFIKDKFFKGENSKRGTGLGLAITNEIITLHGGELNIESTLGKGTTVRVILPLRKDI